MWLNEDLESYDEPILITSSFIEFQGNKVCQR